MEKDFSQKDFNAMSEKAIRSLREMQRQSTNYCENKRREPKKPPKKEEKPIPLPPKEKEKEKFNPISMLMSADRDTLLVMSLVLLLIGDCKDELLILALIYIIM